MKVASNISSHRRFDVGLFDVFYKPDTMTNFFHLFPSLQEIICFHRMLTPSFSIVAPTIFQIILFTDYNNS